MSDGPVDIVLVEDSEHDRELALHVLRNVVSRDRIKMLHDGVAALQYLLPEDDREGKRASDPPRVVLLDLKMPRVDGIEVLRRLREDARTRRVPVVIFTSSQQAGDVAAAYACGTNSYVVKPVDFDEYSARLRIVVDYWLNHNLDTVDQGVSE